MKKTTLTIKTQMSYAIPVAGKIQQYGFCSSLKRWTMTTTVFTLVVFLSVYHAPFGRDSQGASRLAVSFSRSANLIVSPSLRFAAQRGLNPTKRSTAMSKITAVPTPNPAQSPEEPCLYDLEVLLSEHRDKLAFLADTFSQPISPAASWELSQQGQDGLYYILRDLRDSAEKMDQINIALFGDKKEDAHA